jgi:hypothetical protein
MRGRIVGKTFATAAFALVSWLGKAGGVDRWRTTREKLAFGLALAHATMARA